MALILIADDDELVIEVVRSWLNSKGHFVGAVDDGTSVVSIVEFKRPALVILDCRMPELSGIDVLRQIRASPTSYATPVLMLTAVCGQADKEIAMRAGANGYLRKPVDPDQLVSRVETLLNQTELLKQQEPPLQLHRLPPSSERAWEYR